MTTCESSLRGVKHEEEIINYILYCFRQGGIVLLLSFCASSWALCLLEAGAAVLMAKGQGGQGTRQLEKTQRKNWLIILYFHDMYFVFSKLPCAIQTYHLGMHTLFLQSLWTANNGHMSLTGENSSKRVSWFFFFPQQNLAWLIPMGTHNITVFNI